MGNALKVVVYNKVNTARNIKWLGKGQRWIAAKGSIEIDYEPWSCANIMQQKDLLSELKADWIELVLKVQQSDGDYIEIKYDPSGQLGDKTATDNTVKQANVKSNNVLANPESTHIVVAQGNIAAKKLGFKSEPVAPPKSFDLTTKESVGFNKIAAPQAENSSTTADIRDRFTKKADGENIDMAGIAKVFDSLTAEKKWAEALQFLIDVFGEDKITFTTRTIMSLKTFEAVAKKYSL